MFDKIRFEEIEIQGTASTRGVVSGSVRERFQDNQKDFSTFYDKVENPVEYAVEGRAQIIYPAPTSEFARHNLLYVQVFAVFDASSRYFTTRENFPYYLLLYTYEGEGILEYNGVIYRLSPGSGFLIDCRIQHSYHTSGMHWKHALLHFEGATASWLYENYLTDGDPTFCIPQGGRFQDELERLLVRYQASGPYREYETSLQLGKLVMTLIKEKHQDATKIPDYIRALEQQMQSNYTKPLKLDELAASVGVSKYHLERTFKKYVGLSVFDYLIELRMNRACFLLSSTNLPISVVAQVAGFSEYHNFLKLFKARMGMTPKAYRGK